MEDANTNLQIIRDLGLDASLIFDIGAHQGSFSMQASRIFPNATFYLIEPQEALVSGIKDDRFKIVTKAVSLVDGSIDFFHHERLDSSSIRVNNQTRVIGKSKVMSIRGDSLIREISGFPPDILKVDAEGSDLLVLESFGEYLNNIPFVLLEVGISNPFFHNNVSEVDRYMSDNNFDLINVSSAVRNPSCGSIWNADFLYVQRVSDYASRARTWSGD
jgi:FkbM family methyltransferase